MAFYVNDPESTQRYAENFFSKHCASYAFFMSAYRKLAANLRPGLRYDEYYSGLYSGDSWKRFESEVSQLPKTLPVSKTCVLLIPESHSTTPYSFSEEYAMVSGLFKRNGYQVADATEAFYGEAPESLWVAKDDVHPNEK